MGAMGSDAAIEAADVVLMDVRMPDHLHIRLRTNDHGKTGTHQLLVVRNNHANASALVHALHCIRFLSERRSMDTLIVP